MAPTPLLICIVGPTASGKSGLALELAGKLHSDILSLDSQQMYRYMDIGTAKPSAAQLAEILHHFVSHLNPDEAYNAGQFQRDSDLLLKNLFEKNPIQVAAGGSTLYAEALWYRFDEMPAIPPEIRQNLNEEHTRGGLAPLLDELKKADPHTWEQIDRDNPVRVIRALEVFRASGRPISHFRKGRKKRDTAWQHRIYGIDLDRELLYSRIDERVMAMVDAGLEAEVRGLLERGYDWGDPAMLAIGYREWKAFIEGQIGLGEVIALIQRNSRRYAKRQLTFFRRIPDIQWLKADGRDMPKKILNELP